MFINIWINILRNNEHISIKKVDLNIQIFITYQLRYYSNNKNKTNVIYNLIIITRS